MAARKTGAASAAPSAVRVRILPNRAVVIDGATRHEGEECDVPAEDAKALVAEGYAEPASNPKPKAERKPKPPKPARRRPLTPKAIEDGEEERGG